MRRSGRATDPPVATSAAAWRCWRVLAGDQESRRQNVGSPADSEGNGRTANTKKCPFAGEKLEAATGVEPVMEVLQSSVGDARLYAVGRDCAAQSRFRLGADAWRWAGVMSHDDASRRQPVGGNFCREAPQPLALAPSLATGRLPHERHKAVPDFPSIGLVLGVHLAEPGLLAAALGIQEQGGARPRHQRDGRR